MTISIRGRKKPSSTLENPLKSIRYNKKKQLPGRNTRQFLLSGDHGLRKNVQHRRCGFIHSFVGRFLVTDSSAIRMTRTALRNQADHRLFLCKATDYSRPLPGCGTNGLAATGGSLSSVILQNECTTRIYTGCRYIRGTKFGTKVDIYISVKFMQRILVRYIQGVDIFVEQVWNKS